MSDVYAAIKAAYRADAILMGFTPAQSTTDSVNYVEPSPYSDQAPTAVIEPYVVISSILPGKTHHSLNDLNRTGVQHIQITAYHVDSIKLKCLVDNILRVFGRSRFLGVLSCIMEHEPVYSNSNRKTSTGRSLLYGACTFTVTTSN